MEGMWRWFWSLGLLLGLVGLQGCEGFQSHSLKLNQPLPVIEVVDLAQRDSSLAPLPQVVSQLTIVKVWVTWCVACREMDRSLQALIAEYEDKDIQLWTLAVDSQRYAVDEYWLDHSRPYRKFWDPNMQNTSRIWGVKAVPTLLFLDQNGHLIHYQIGALNAEAVEALSSWLARFVAESDKRKAASL